MTRDEKIKLLCEQLILDHNAGWIGRCECPQCTVARELLAGMEKPRCTCPEGYYEKYLGHRYGCPMIGGEHGGDA